MIVLKKDINASNYITAVKSNKEKKTCMYNMLYNNNPQY
jgi:hypothetical protein